MRSFAVAVGTDLPAAEAALAAVVAAQAASVDRTESQDSCCHYTYAYAGCKG